MGVAMMTQPSSGPSMLESELHHGGGAGKGCLMRTVRDDVLSPETCDAERGAHKLPPPTGG